MRKNIASQKWRVFAFNRTTGTPVTGDAANITARLAIDHGTISNLDDSNPTETEDGYYLFDLTQTETDGDVLSIYPESSTTDVQVVGSPSDVTTIPTVEDIDGHLSSQHGGDEWDTDQVYAALPLLLRTTIDTVSSQTVFTLATIGSPDDDAYNGMTAKITCNGDTTQVAVCRILDYVASTRQMTLESAPLFTIVSGDRITIHPEAQEKTVSVITSILSGITSLADWLRAFFRKDSADTTAMSEINNGGGTYDETTDSVEALRDRGDVAWTTGSGETSPTVEEIRQEIDSNSTQLSVIKSKTDQLTFTTPNQVDANSISGGTGPSVESIRQEIDNNSSKLAEILEDTSEIGIAGAGLNDLGGMSDTMKDQVNAEVDQALADFGPPTKEELNTALATYGVSVANPKSPNTNTITIVRGDDYTESASRKIVWTASSADQWPDLTDATITFTAKRDSDSLTKTGSVISATGTQSFQVELTASDTDISIGWWDYDVQATYTNGDVVTLVIGRMRVIQDYT